MWSGVWCGMSRKRIAGPIFFITTVTGWGYVILFNSLCQLGKSDCRTWLQQDNICPHASTNTMNFLHKIFNERLISTNLWPPRSSDLSPLDFFLWGYSKNCVYMTTPRNLKELKGSIAREIENIDQKTLKRVFLNSVKRCPICKANSDGHFQHLL